MSTAGRFKLLAAAAVVMTLGLAGCGGDSGANSSEGDGGGGGGGGGGDDYIGKGNDISNYRTVTIGTQTWMAENLDYNVEGSKCYNNSADSCARYGRLYNWATAMGGSPSSSNSPSGVRGVCPVGWHLPSHAEWTQLTDFVGGSSTAGGKLKSTSGWYNNGNGTDEFGFSALPGGHGNRDGSFINAGRNGDWWSATENDAYYAWYRHMYYNGEYVYGDYHVKTGLFSVRCVKN